MSRVGLAVAEPDAGAFPEGLGDPGAHQYPAEGQVAAGHALGEGDHVGPQVEAVDPPPGSQPPEGGDHAVGDEERPVPAAELGQALQVVGGHAMHAAGADDRLGEDRGHPAGPDPLEFGFEGLERIPRNVGRLRVHRAHPGLVGGDSPDRRAEPVGPVVALGAADDVGALGITDGLEVAPGQLGRGVDRVATAEVEKYPRAVHDLFAVGGKAVGELECRAVGEGAEGLVGGQLRHLGGYGVGNLLAAVAGVDAPQAGGAVEVFVALGVPDPGTLSPLDDQLVAGNLRHVGERVPEAAGRGHRVPLTAGRKVR